MANAKSGWYLQIYEIKLSKFIWLFFHLHYTKVFSRGDINNIVCGIHEKWSLSVLVILV